MVAPRLHVAIDVGTSAPTLDSTLPQMLSRMRYSGGHWCRTRQRLGGLGVCKASLRRHWAARDAEQGRRLMMASGATIPFILELTGELTGGAFMLVDTTVRRARHAPAVVAVRRRQLWQPSLRQGCRPVGPCR